jgi:hypothetical protein
MTSNQLKNKMYYQDKKIIESKLHPNPFFNGIEICHEHRGKNIIFTAWKGQDKVNEKELIISRNRVLYYDDIYGLYKEYFERLVE